jgi:hypothetical protein
MIIAIANAALLFVGLVGLAVLVVVEYGAWRRSSGAQVDEVEVLQARQRGEDRAMPPRRHRIDLKLCVVTYAVALIAYLAVAATMGSAGVRTAWGTAQVEAAASIGLFILLGVGGDRVPRLPAWTRSPGACGAIAALMGAMGAVADRVAG